MKNDLDEFLDASRRGFTDAVEPFGLLETYDRFLEELRSFAGLTEAAVEPVVREHGAFYRRVQQRVLELQELEESKSILADADAPHRKRGERFSGAFAVAAYSRVEDLARLADISDFRRVVVAGCGALPSSLLWMADHFPAAEYVGLDIEDRCVETATLLSNHLGLHQATFACLDATEFDYAGVDFVFVANQVHPKRSVLERLAATTDRSVSVVVREPTSIGRLLAEPVRDDLPPGYTVTRTGTSSAAFLSQDVFLDLDV